MNTKNLDAYWSELYDAGRDYRYIMPSELTKLLQSTDVKLQKICLDIGCGTGQLTRELYHRGYACVGVDASASAVKIASSLTTVTSESLQYLQFDIENDEISALPLQPYSLITCKFVYAFIKDKPTFLKKVRQLLEPNGVLVVITSHVQDLPMERRGIGVDEAGFALLAQNFTQLARYKGDERDGALTYFIGQV